MKNETIKTVVLDQMNKRGIRQDARVGFQSHRNGYFVGVRVPQGWTPGTPHLPHLQEWSHPSIGFRVWGIAGETAIRSAVDKFLNRHDWMLNNKAQ